MDSLSIKPESFLKYQIIAYRQWLIDQGDVPYMQIDTTQPGVTYPHGFENAPGKLVLDINPLAVSRFDFSPSGDRLIVGCRFIDGPAFEVITPLSAVRMVYGRRSQIGGRIRISNSNRSTLELIRHSTGAPADNVVSLTQWKVDHLGESKHG